MLDAQLVRICDSIGASAATISEDRKLRLHSVGDVHQLRSNGSEHVCVYGGASKPSARAGEGGRREYAAGVSAWKFIDGRLEHGGGPGGAEQAAITSAVGAVHERGRELRACASLLSSEAVRSDVPSAERLG